MVIVVVVPVAGGGRRREQRPQRHRMADRGQRELEDEPQQGQQRDPAPGPRVERRSILLAHVAIVPPGAPGRKPPRHRTVSCSVEAFG
jgi:hypothetical protein